MMKRDSRKIPKKSEIWHLVKRGMLTQIHYDLEVTELDTYFAQLLQFGGVVSDIGGNVLDTLEVKSQCPDYAVLSPQAAVITRTHPKDLKNGDPPHIVAGKVMELFRTAHQRVWDNYTEEEDVTYKEKGKTKEETIRLFPVENDDGVIEYVWIHKEGQYISYEVPSRDEILSETSDTRVLRGDGREISRDDTRRFITYEDDEGNIRRRKKVPYGVKMASYRGIYADDKWLWSTFQKAGFPEIFVTHLKKHHKHRIDISRLAHMTYLFGPQGEERLRRGTKIMQETGEEMPSFSLEQLMQANAWRESPDRGLQEGARLPDGSIYDPDEAHKSPLYDCMATLGLDMFLRRLAPDIVRHAEECADIDKMQRFLVGRKGFEDHPLLAFGRYTFPDMTAHMGILVHLDAAYGDRKQALLIRVDKNDPERYHYKNKPLLELSEDEIADMIRHQRGKPTALFEIIHQRKNPNVVDVGAAVANGVYYEESLEEMERRRRVILQNPGFVERAMKGYAKAMATFKRAEDVPCPQPEEEVFSGVGELPYYQGINRWGNEVRLLDVHQRAEDIWNYGRKVTEYLKAALEPDPIEWQDARTSEFYKKCKKAQKSLDHVQAEQAKGIDLGLSRYAPARETAIDCLWQMRQHHMRRYIDHTLTYEVRDRHGHKVPFEDLINMPKRERQKRFEEGDLHIEFERMWHSTQFAIERFVTGGRPDLLSENALGHFEARTALRIHGPPNEDPDQHRWMSVPRALRELQRLQNNVKNGTMARAAFEDEYGLYDAYISNRDEAEAILEELGPYYRDLLRKHPVTPEKLLMAGYDPGTGWPIERIEHEIPRKSILVIDVPDRHIEQPLAEETLFNRFVLVRAPKGLGLSRIQKHLEKGGNIVLRGAQSGRHYLAATAVAGAPPPESGLYTEVYRQARKGYTDSGDILPRHTDKMIMIGFETAEPLANWRPVDPALQAIKVPHPEDFIAMVSPELGYTNKPLKGLVLQDYDYSFTPGKARFQEMKDGTETGWEVETIIKSVRKVTLANLKEEMDTGTFTDADARRYGYAGTGDMHDKVSQIFVDHLKDRGRKDNTLVLIDFKTVDKDTMTYFNPAVTPRASIRRDYTADIGAARKAKAIAKARRKHEGRKWGSYELSPK